MSHKRKYDGSQPPAKKPRQSSGHHTTRPPYVHTLRQDQPAIEPPILASPLPPIDIKYESAVFTHQSVVGARDNTTDMKSYERLEFLGDAYLELFASRLLWKQFPDLPTGRLSQIREGLVKNETLARFSVNYGFDTKLRKPETLTLDNSPTWVKIKGDMFEAYVAAVVLSDPVNGFAVAEEWLTQLWMPKLKDVKGSTTNLKAKEELARKLLVSGIQIDYVEERPPIQDRKRGTAIYTVGVYLTGWGWQNQHLGSGKGLNKVAAGNEAAMRAFEDNKDLIEEAAKKRNEWLAKKKEEDQRPKEDMAPNA